MPPKNAKKTPTPRKTTLNRKRTGQRNNGPPATNVRVLAPREVLASLDNNVSRVTDNARAGQPTVEAAPIATGQRLADANTPVTGSNNSPGISQTSIRITNPHNVPSRSLLRPSLNPLPRDASGRLWQPRTVVGRQDAESIPTVDQVARADDDNDQDLRTTLANVRAALLTESRARVQAESRASRLENEVRAQRALEVANKYTPIPRPKLTKNSTWTMARLEEVLGLPHRNGDGPVNKARGVIYNWAQHISRWVLSWSHRHLEVDNGALFKKLTPDQKTAMMDKFQEQVKRVDFLFPVFYHAPNLADQFTGGSRFVKDWPMKEMLMRSMKNERDGLYRPTTYRKRIQRLRRAAKIATELARRTQPNYKQPSLLQKSLVRRDANGHPANGNIWEEDHDSAVGDEEEEDEEGATADSTLEPTALLAEQANTETTTLASAMAEHLGEQQYGSLQDWNGIDDEVFAESGGNNDDIAFPGDGDQSLDGADDLNGEQQEEDGS